MRKINLTKIVMIFTIISTVITLVSVGFTLLMRRPEASSIGIIGGADGPTAVYVASQLSPHVFTGIAGLISIAGMIYLFFSKK